MSCFRVQKHDPILETSVASSKKSISGKTTIGIVSTVVLSFLCAGGVTLIVVTVFYVPKSLFMPLMITGSGISGGSFILIVAIAITGVAMTCQDKAENKNKKSEKPIGADAEQIVDSAEHNPVKPGRSGVPGSFLSPTLNGICWANVTLHALRLLDDEHKAILREIGEDHPNFKVIDIVRTMLDNLDNGFEVSKEEMEELMVEMNSDEVLKTDSFGLNPIAGMDYREPFLDQFLNCVFSGDDGLIKRHYPKWRNGFPKTFNFNCRLWSNAKSLTEAFARDRFNPTYKLPTTLFIERDPKVDRVMVADDKKKGEYYADVMTSEGLMRYKYAIKGRVIYHSSNEHYTFKMDLGNGKHVHYNEKTAKEYSYPLKDQRLECGDKYWIFHLCGEPEKL